MVRLFAGANGRFLEEEKGLERAKERFWVNPNDNVKRSVRLAQRHSGDKSLSRYFFIEKEWRVQRRKVKRESGLVNCEDH